ncbi:MAG TPA: serine hydrolase domain-containing protein [Pyrinomonadaceae bacterium]|nr:serine hydrolase domain-containing protein [Pyrinomonadaceae bacterium]
MTLFDYRSNQLKIRPALILLSVLAITPHAQTQNGAPVVKTGRVDEVVKKAAQKFMSDSHSVGLSVGVYQDGRTYTHNFGEVAKGKKESPTRHTIYEVGSITKTFTGLLLARAAAERKVSLDDDVRKYLDGSYPNLEFEGRPIKLFHLINHTSGLPFTLPNHPELFKNPDYYELPKILTRIESSYTRANFYDDLHKVKLDKVPGTEFRYSNSGAQLLGFILEKVYRMPYEKIVLKKIAGPLKMTETKLTLTGPEKKRLAQGHYENGSVALRVTPQSQAAGGLHSTVSDMLKYVRFHLDESDEAVKLSHQTTWGDIKYYASGLNWQMIQTPGGHRKIWQSGGTFGFSSHCVIFPELRMGIVLLSNESDVNSQGRLNEMANEILAGVGVN